VAENGDKTATLEIKMRDLYDRWVDEWMCDRNELLLLCSLVCWMMMIRRV
jgi:hypothetical protein